MPFEAVVCGVGDAVEEEEGGEICCRWYTLGTYVRGVRVGGDGFYLWKLNDTI